MNQFTKTAGMSHGPSTRISEKLILKAFWKSDQVLDIIMRSAI